jgi:hypothetical protein
MLHIAPVSFDFISTLIRFIFGTQRSRAVGLPLPVWFPSRMSRNQTKLRHGTSAWQIISSSPTFSPAAAMRLSRISAVQTRPDRLPVDATDRLDRTTKAAVESRERPSTQPGRRPGFRDVTIPSSFVVAATPLKRVKIPRFEPGTTLFSSEPPRLPHLESSSIQSWRIPAGAGFSYSPRVCNAETRAKPIVDQHR